MADTMTNSTADEVGFSKLCANNLECMVVGGRLRLFCNEWEKLTSDKSILQAITGYNLEFGELGRPSHQFFAPFPYKLTCEERQCVTEEIQKLLEKRVIEPTCYEHGQFISNIFTRKKKDGGLRTILDLSLLNQYIDYKHFKMDTFESATNLVQPNCYMASLDLKDAYYSVPIAVECRKLLKFQWSNALYQYTALPNGLSSGPRIFTKILKPPFSRLRSMGHIIPGYIDDTLIIASSKEEAERSVQLTAQTLEKLGFLIHPTKSIFIPRQSIEYLGFNINSVDMKISLPDSKKRELKEVCQSLLDTNKPTIKHVAMVIGKLVASFPAVQHGTLHYRQLEKDKTTALRANCGHFDRHMHLSVLSRIELSWWINNVCQSFSCICHGKPDVVLTSDASGKGWGGNQWFHPHWRTLEFQ